MKLKFYDFEVLSHYFLPSCICHIYTISESTNSKKCFAFFKDGTVLFCALPNEFFLKCAEFEENMFPCRTIKEVLKEWGA